MFWRTGYIAWIGFVLANPVAGRPGGLGVALIGFGLVNPLARVWPALVGVAVAGIGFVLANPVAGAPGGLNGALIGFGLVNPLPWAWPWPALVGTAVAGIGFVFANPGARGPGGLGVAPIGFGLVNPLPWVWPVLVDVAVAGIGFVFANPGARGPGGLGLAPIGFELVNLLARVLAGAGWRGCRRDWLRIRKSGCEWTERARSCPDWLRIGKSVGPGLGRCWLAWLSPGLASYSQIRVRVDRAGSVLPRLASNWLIRSFPALAAAGPKRERWGAAFVLPDRPDNLAGEPALQFS